MIKAKKIENHPRLKKFNRNSILICNVIITASWRQVVGKRALDNPNKALLVGLKSLFLKEI